MALTLTSEQQAFMANASYVTALAAWVLRAENHVAESARFSARMPFRQSHPQQSDVASMVKYLTSYAEAGLLVRLINGYQQSLRAPSRAR